MSRRTPRRARPARIALVALVCVLVGAACGPAGGDGGDSAGASDGAGSAIPANGVGAVAPAVVSQTLDGDSVSLAALRGSPVLLNVWATWCHPCREEIPVLQALHERYRPRGLRVVGVTVDDEGATADIRAFATEYGVTYDLWHDPDKRVMARYSVIGVPTSVLVNRAGRVTWRRTGEVKANDPALAAALEQALAER